MEIVQLEGISAESIGLYAQHLRRTVKIDFYYEAGGPGDIVKLLLFNDAQELVNMNFAAILEKFLEEYPEERLLVAGIHAGTDRKNEYGMSIGPDYQGLGSKAKLYEGFVVDELLPFIYNRFSNYRFSSVAFAGFSLGGLSALDIVWNNPEVFSKAGVFSGALWWRSVSKDDKHYNQDLHRMMHAQVRSGTYCDGLQFFFECGDYDELEDRNKNGVIDSIDDTIDLMRELIRKGYHEGRDMHYLQLPDGKHEASSWARAMPVFLKWLARS